MKVWLALVFYLALFPRLAVAQAVYETEVGRVCIDRWTQYFARTLNSYSGDANFNAQRPWSINQYGLMASRSGGSAFEPDGWAAQYNADRATYLWLTNPVGLTAPFWSNPNFNAAGLEGLQSWVAGCISDAGGLTGGGAPSPDGPPYETALGRACIDRWTQYTARTLNSYSGDANYNAQRPWSINQYGLFASRSGGSAFEPDGWASQYNADRATFLWLTHTEMSPVPTWSNPNFNAAGLAHLRPWVLSCIADAGGSVVGGATGTPGPAGGGSTGGTVGATPPTGSPGTPAPVTGWVPTGRCPDSLSPVSSYPGAILGCTCQADQITGTVWGSHPYTFDSSLCMAAVHAGAIPSSGGVVWATVTDTLPAFVGTSRNGITTQDYGEYGPTMTILNAGAVASFSVVEQVAACPSTMGAELETIRCHCNPDRMTGISGIWGTNGYTFDSNICIAARHAGVVSPDGGIVTVERIPDLGNYVGTTQNGVTSGSYGAWEGAFVFR